MSALAKDPQQLPGEIEQQQAVVEQHQPQEAEEQQELQQELQNLSQADKNHHEDQCHICMSSMKEPTAVKGCGHQFCRGCIEQWVGTRQQPCCPVCRADVKALILEDGSEQVAEPAAAEHPSEAEPDLSCLDHSYFLAECARLQSRAQSVHNRVYREAYGCGKRGGAHQTGLLLDGVQDVIELLAGYRSTLEGEMRFDPQMLLHELYRLDRQLTSLQAGSSSSAADPSGPADAADPWQQQQAADSFARMNIHADDDDSHEHEIDYYDHDYDSGGDDDWHEGLSRTPGRRPTQRNAVKHARSNSGGGPGQQQQRQQLTPQQRGPIPRWRQGQGQGRQRGGGNGPT